MLADGSTAWRLPGKIRRPPFCASFSSGVLSGANSVHTTVLIPDAVAVAEPRLMADGGR